MDLYPSQGIDTLKSALIHSYSLPVLMHFQFIEEGLDRFIPCAHCCSANGDKKVVTLTRVALPCLLPWLSQKFLHRDGKGALINLKVMSSFPTYLISLCP